MSLALGPDSCCDYADTKSTSIRQVEACVLPQHRISSACAGSCIGCEYSCIGYEYAKTCACFSSSSTNSTCSQAQLHTLDAAITCESALAPCLRSSSSNAEDLLSLLASIVNADACADAAAAVNELLLVHWRYQLPYTLTQFNMQSLESIMYWGLSSFGRARA
jgi:hypothetical protein